jgi:hypothetical protein
MISREKLLFALLALADRTHRGQPDGKGLNKYDYVEFTRQWMPGSILNCSEERVREWARRISKYRKQLEAAGMEYPACILSDR